MNTDPQHIDITPPPVPVKPGRSDDFLEKPAELPPEDALPAPSATGKDSPPVNVRDITGFIERVSTAPTQAPKNLFQQIKLYVSGTTYRLYIYDYQSHAWHYVALT